MVGPPPFPFSSIRCPASEDSTPSAHHSLGQQAKQRIAWVKADKGARTEPICSRCARATESYCQPHRKSSLITPGAQAHGEPACILTSLLLRPSLSSTRFQRLLAFDTLPNPATTTLPRDITGSLLRISYFGFSYETVKHTKCHLQTLSKVVRLRPRSLHHHRTANPTNRVENHLKKDQTFLDPEHFSPFLNNTREASVDACIGPRCSKPNIPFPLLTTCPLTTGHHLYHLHLEQPMDTILPGSPCIQQRLLLGPHQRDILAGQPRIRHSRTRPLEARHTSTTHTRHQATFLLRIHHLSANPTM